MPSTTDVNLSEDRGIDYLVKVDALVYAQYVNELKHIALKGGKSKTLNIVTKILPGGATGVWFEVKVKTPNEDKTASYASLETALRAYNETRLDLPEKGDSFYEDSL